MVHLQALVLHSGILPSDRPLRSVVPPHPFFSFDGVGTSLSCSFLDPKWKLGYAFILLSRLVRGRTAVGKTFPLESLEPSSVA